MGIQIEPSWKQVLQEAFEQPYFQEITAFVKSEIQSGKTLFPPGPQIFSAFDRCPWDRVRVVILGQDPYHTPGAAMGLCFSVPQDQRIPPSLQNIYKELSEDIPGFQAPNHGDLSPWADQGVLLLNSALTVPRGQANAHAEIWAPFTDRIIQKISEEKSGIIFILWGRFAQSKKVLIDLDKHSVLEAAHPSPFSAHNGFFGSRPFSQTNAILKSQGHSPINWQN